MRILCLTARLPYPPDRGDRLRAYHILRALAPHHQLHLISFIAHDAERVHLPELRRFCEEVQVVRQSPLRAALTVAGNAWRRAPLQLLYYRSRPMQQQVTAALRARRFDSAYVHLFRMAPYLAGTRDLYRIVDLTDVISAEVARSLAFRNPLSRLLYRLEGPRISAYERHLVDTFEEAWLISEADRRLLAGAHPRANLQVVPNGVDMAALYPLEAAPRPDSLLFVGHLRVFHNVDAAIHLARAILPLVRRECPETTLRLVGADPGPDVRRLAGLPGVEVTGFVPDLNEALNQAAVFVAPLRFAAGVQNKVLEAMAAARPVVTSSLVNAGLGATPGEHLLVADGPEETARAIIRLLRDEAARRRLGTAARQFVAARFRWDDAVERMDAIEAALR